MLIPLIIAGGLILFFALLGLIAVGADRRRRRQREELLAERRAGPSSIRLPSSPPPDESSQDELPAAPPALVSRPSAPVPPTPSSFTPSTPPPRTVGRIEPPLPSTPVQHTKSPAQTPLPQPSVGISPLLEEPSFPSEIGGDFDVPPPSIAFPSKEQPPQVLFLDPDYELAEIKRVLRIWQMTQDPESPMRWKNSDGTQIELRDRDGFPCLEIRGPLAGDLAEYLPQDLPVRPDLAHPPT